MLTYADAQMAFVTSRLASGSKGALGATMEAAKEAENLFRRQFEDVC